MARTELLKMRLLGELEIQRGSQRLELPQSKKTRGLLAYLAMVGKPVRRERLCSLFWDVADDPRGALRWSLSRLRGLVDGPKRQRIVADRDSVRFDGSDLWIDAAVVEQDYQDLPSDAAPDRLKQIAAMFRGEFLEGLELPDFDEFQAWRLGQIERFRLLHVKILSTLVPSIAVDSAQALPYARELVQIDPLNESGHAQLVKLLFAAGRTKEAEYQYEGGLRILKEAGIGSSGLLLRARESSRSRAAPPAGKENAQPQQPAEGVPGSTRLVGRIEECSALCSILDETEKQRRENIVLVVGETGIGKTRLISEIVAAAQAKGATVIEGRSYEAESLRPYGPWIDALRKVPASTVGETIGADLAPMVPEFGSSGASQHTRDQMYGGVVEFIAARAHTSGLVTLVLDDIQWCDEASAALLHYAIRSNRHRPVLVLLGARSGELLDNEAVLRLLRGLRRDGMVQQIELGPLTPEETQELAELTNPAAKDLRVFEETAGNPLFTIEVARSGVRRDGVPQSLAELVRDRIDRLPAPAGDVLRWGAALGSTFTSSILEQLPGFDADTLVTALEKLEKHGLIRHGGSYDGRDACVFTSNVVWRVAYADISEPRRRMMHGRVAQFLASMLEANDSIATDVVQHAALAGDVALAARACVGAGRRCLKLFANTQAETFARRGIRFAEQLEEPERTKLLIELTRVSVQARRPDELHQAARDIEHLGERALDYSCMAHARLAFHVSSYLRWEDGDWSVAERDTLRAEVISRSAGEKERVTALAEAARCLTMLERDLAHASSLLLEAANLAERIGEETVAIHIAEGLLHQHGGRNAHAAKSFESALELARRDRDRLDEFSALEHLVLLKTDLGEYADALALAQELIRIGDKFREGSEAPFARALFELIRHGLAGAEADAFDSALTQLRQCDAKNRMAFVLTRAALIDLRKGDFQLAAQRASQGLNVAEKMNRPSEIAIALAVLNRAAGDQESKNRWRDRLDGVAVNGLRRVSAYARSAVDGLTDIEFTEGPRWT